MTTNKEDDEEAALNVAGDGEFMEYFSSDEKNKRQERFRNESSDMLEGRRSFIYSTVWYSTHQTDSRRVGIK